MSSTTATASGMIAALERWAIASERWNSSSADWRLSPHGDGVHIFRDPKSWSVTPEVAIAWALTVGDCLPPVDTGRCLACVNRSVPGRKLATSEWFADWDNSGSRLATERHYRESGKKGRGAGWKTLLCQPHDPRPSEGINGTQQPWLRARRAGEPEPRWFYLIAWRPCPACNGTGRETRDAACLVLDAAAREKLGGCGEEVSTTHRSGDVVAGDHLRVLVDHLQARGERLGTTLACMLRLWAAGDLRETRAAVEDLTRAWERLTIPCSCQALLPYQREFMGECKQCLGHDRVKPSEASRPHGRSIDDVDDASGGIPSGERG